MAGDFKMKILFPLLYIAEHSGDNAIWAKLIKTIEEVYPNSEYICPIQFSPDDTETLKWDIEQLKRYSPNIRVIPNCLTNGFDYQTFKQLQTEEEVINYMDSLPISDYIKESDMVISMGGGYMFNDAVDCFYFPPFYQAQKLGKPTFFNTQTFAGNDLSFATQALGHLIFEKANYISPRENLSLQTIQNQFKIDKDIIVSQDFTFDVEPEPFSMDLPKDAIKINIRHDVVDEHCIEVMAQVADMVVETMGEVVFVPICHGGERDDRITHRAIANKMKHDSILIEEQITVGQAKTIAKGGIFITNRYHTSIFSSSAGTPIVPLMPDIDYKMSGLLESLNYPDIKVLNLKTASANEIFEQVKNVWDNREDIKKLLDIQVPKIIKEVKESTERLKDSLRNI
jgi:polysaccharide pyruvyl transferase WcaK-like protein